MSVRIIIITIDILLWTIIAANVAYIVFFAFASLLPKKKQKQSSDTSQKNSSFIVLFPAYHEDAVILNSVKSFLKQDYPQESYHMVVISDHMEPETNEELSQLPITLLQPSFEKSSKAKALQYAISHVSFFNPHSSNYIVILDADNIVQSNFLSQINSLCQHGNKAIQCHRTAKNNDNDIAALDGLSEEINNTIFRIAHNAIGLSSALIGSGMCFEYEWFAQNVTLLDSAVEDRELEALLMKQGIYIYYAEDIHVLDEKVSNSNNFQRQRLRWMTGQVQAFFRMMPYIPKAIVTANVNYIDKTIQQMLIPRSILMAIIPCITITTTFLSLSWSYKWWGMLLCFGIALLIAIPKRLRTRALFGRLGTLPKLIWHMFSNIIRMDRHNTDFIHTTHEK